MNGTIKAILRRHFISCDTFNWVKMLPKIQFNVNCSKHTSTSYPPFLLHGVKQDDILQMAQEAEKVLPKIYPENIHGDELDVLDDATEEEVQKIIDTGIPKEIKTPSIKKGKQKNIQSNRDTTREQI